MKAPQSLTPNQANRLIQSMRRRNWVVSTNAEKVVAPATVFASKSKGGKLASVIITFTAVSKRRSVRLKSRTDLESQPTAGWPHAQDVIRYIEKQENANEESTADQR